MKSLFKNWTIWRALRLILGILVINEAGTNDSFALYMLGGFLFMHALLNIQCSASGCNVSENENHQGENPVIKTSKLDLNAIRKKT